MENQNLLFQEYEPVKQILSIGQYALVKYEKKETIEKDPTELKRIGSFESDMLDEVKRQLKKKRGITNQRQSVIKEIQEIIESENGGKINARVLAMKLSHVPTEDLYFMKSQGKDYRARTGKPFSKYIYGSIKVNNEKEEKK